MHNIFDGKSLTIELVEQAVVCIDHYYLLVSHCWPWLASSLPIMRERERSLFKRINNFSVIIANLWSENHMYWPTISNHFLKKMVMFFFVEVWTYLSLRQPPCQCSWYCSRIESTSDWTFLYHWSRTPVKTVIFPASSGKYCFLVVPGSGYDRDRLYMEWSVLTPCEQQKSSEGDKGSHQWLTLIWGTPRTRLRYNTSKPPLNQAWTRLKPGLNILDLLKK